MSQPFIFVFKNVSKSIQKAKPNVMILYQHSLSNLTVICYIYIKKCLAWKRRDLGNRFKVKFAESEYNCKGQLLYKIL